MPEKEGRPRAYCLKEGVRVFRSGEAIRFRKGVWSYNEAAVRLAGQEESVVRFFDATFERLLRGQEAAVDEIAAAVGADAEGLDACCEVLEGLRAQQFLIEAGSRDAARVVSALLGGNLSGLENYVGAVRPVLFFADSDHARQAAKTIAHEIGLPLDLLDPEVTRKLARADLTTRTDALLHNEAVAGFERILSPYCCVLGCVAAPDAALLRNLNRLLVHAQKPLVLGMIDGPFVSLLSTLATQTGCFECYEQRMLARLEDTLVYHQFVEAAAGTQAPIGPSFTPPLHILTSAVVSEGFLYSTLSVLPLAGRIVNVYLPLLEIQVQDLLRVPYCPACGFVSRAQMNEMYTSTKRLVTEMLATVELEG